MPQFLEGQTASSSTPSPLVGEGWGEGADGILPHPHSLFGNAPTYKGEVEEGQGGEGDEEKDAGFPIGVGNDRLAEVL